MSAMADHAFDVVTALMAIKGIPTTDADAFNNLMSALMSGQTTFTMGSER